MSSKLVLLVEDELFISDLYKRILSQSGFTVLTAYDGQEALTLSQNHPDIILLDVMLPKKHGIDVLREIKSNPQTNTVPILLLTNLGQEDIIKAAFELGASGYILKMKVSPYELVEKIKEFIDNPSKVMDLKELSFD